MGKERAQWPCHRQSRHLLAVIYFNCAHSAASLNAVGKLIIVSEPTANSKLKTQMTALPARSPESTGLASTVNRCEWGKFPPLRCPVLLSLMFIQVDAALLPHISCQLATWLPVRGPTPATEFPSNVIFNLCIVLPFVQVTRRPKCTPPNEGFVHRISEYIAIRAAKASKWPVAN